MDFSSIVKGASDAFKKLETDVTNVSKDMAKDASGWKGWAANAGEDDDGWEDVGDIASDVGTLPRIPTREQNKTPEKKSNEDKPKEEEEETVEVSNGNNVVVETASTIEESGDDSGKVKELERKLQDALAKANAQERKVYALTKDRDALRRIRDSRNSDAELVKEKDKQISAVMAEGEKLSIKIAEKEKTVRNLRANVKEKDSLVENLQLSLSATEAKLEAATSRQRQLETSEKAAQDGMEAAEKRLRQVESDARSKISSSAALEAARAQLESLRKGQAASLENQAMRLRAEHDAALDKVKADAKSQEDTLNKAINELRAHLAQMMDNTGWKEDHMRKEMDELRKRAEQLEARNEELAAALPNATRPLLRQVEALQAAASERLRAKSAVDRSQLERLRAAEASLAKAGERERAAEERIGTLITKVATLEEQIRLSQADQTRVSAEVRALQSENAEMRLRHQKDLEAGQAKVMKANREKESGLQELSTERASHLDYVEQAEEKERQMRATLAALEAKVEMMSENLTKATAQSAPISMSPSASGRLPRFDSMGNVSSTSFGFVGSDYADDISLLAEGASSSAGLYATEMMSATLRQKRGEVSSLQSQLDGKEAATKALAEEIVSLTAKVEELTREKNDAPQTQKKFAELERRHNALLELLGEREEKISELQADLEDVNQLYKDQMTELLLRIEKLSS